MRNSSFDAFPAMDHAEVMPASKTQDHQHAVIPENAKFKWITFSRNRSWFIFRYDSFRFINYRDAELFHEGSDDLISIDSRQYKVNDPLIRYNLEGQMPPQYFLLIEHEKQKECHAADRQGKRIFSESDVISPMIIPFAKSMKYRGRVRIFGKNHIYL